MQIQDEQPSRILLIVSFLLNFGAARPAPALALYYWVEVAEASLDQEAHHNHPAQGAIPYAAWRLLLKNAGLVTEKPPK